MVGRVSPLELGPPVGWPVQYRVSGPDPSVVRSIALDLAEVVAASPDTLRTNFDWVEPTREVRIRVDQDEARLLGLSSEALAGVLNTVITGAPVTQVRDDIYLVNVLARATDEQRVSLSTLPTLQVPLPNGRTVPLSQFAELRVHAGLPADLAPRPGADPDRPGGRGTRHAAGRGGGRGARARRSSSCGRACPRATRSRPAARSRRAPSSQASVVAVVPVMLLIMLTVLMFELRELPPPVHRADRGAAGADRRRRGPAAVRPAARVRGDPGLPGAARHDHQERGDPGRPDRGRARGRPQRVRRSARGRQPPASGRSC